MKHEEQPGTAGSEKELGWRLCLSWKRKLKTKEERVVGSLIWMGRGVILFSVLAMPLVYTSIFPWLATAMLLIYPLYVVIYRKAIRIRRPEVVILMVIALALAALWVWVGLRDILDPLPSDVVHIYEVTEVTR